MLLKLTALRMWFVICTISLSTITFAQQKLVTGKVTDPNNQPIIGATVVVPGTNVATQTDVNGNFSINVPAGKNSLLLSSVGYETREIALKGGAVTAVLNVSTSNLNEVVVIGYGSQKKKDITGSVAVVNVNNLKTVPSGTVESLLQGQASGVTIVNSGVPGGGSNVRIRGITSVGSTDPLVIVDGTP